MSSQKNPAISIARVLGMLLVVLCHIVKFYPFIPGSDFLGQIFGVGVHMFLFISGYLYGGKTVTSIGKWYAQRFLIVSLPAIILSVIIMISQLILDGSVSVNTFIVYSLDLEGLSFLNTGVLSFFSEIDLLGHLWFTTVIMLCYLFIPLLQKIKLPSSSSVGIALMSTFLAIGVGLCYITFLFCNLTFFFLFIIGYFLGKVRFLDRIRLKFFISYTVILIAAVAGRLILRHYMDNSVIYTFYVHITNLILGTWPVFFIALLHNKSARFITAVADWRITKLFDKYSFYIYLTHGVFCSGGLNMYHMLSLPLATIAFVLCTIVSALVLKWICDLVTKPLLNRLRA